MVQPPTAGPQQPSEEAGATAYCYRHPDRPTGLSCVRCERAICTDCLNPASVGFQCPECAGAGAGAVRRPTAPPQRVSISRRLGPVTTVLMAINAIMFGLTAVQAGSIDQNLRSRIFVELAMHGPWVDRGEVWRLITSTFLHIGLMHLAFNLFALYLFGRDIERVFGPVRYAALYLLSGLGGSVAVYFATPEALVAGASGSVFGLLGAALVVMLMHGQNVTGLVVLLGINIVIGFLPGISFAAHFGGFVVGAVMAYVFVLMMRRSRKAPQRRG